MSHEITRFFGRSVRLLVPTPLRIAATADELTAFVPETLEVDLRGWSYDHVHDTYACARGDRMLHIDAGAIAKLDLADAARVFLLVINDARHARRSSSYARP